MKLEEDSLKCICGKWARPATVRMEGLVLRGWRCSACGEEYIHPEDSLRFSAYKQLQAKAAEATVAQVGNSLAIRIRKEIAQALGLHVGEKLSVVVSPPNKLVFKVAGA